MPTPIPQVLDGKYVELWSVPAWRRKLGIGDVGQTLSERIKEIIVESGGGDSDIDEAGTRLAEFATLNEAGYIVQTTVSPPTFAGRQIRGTPNQINVLYGTGIPGDTVLSAPQNIHTAATPSFHTIKPTLLSREFVTYVNGIGELDSTSVTADALNTISAGIGGYFPYWLSTGGLSPTSPIYTDGTRVGIGTDLPAVLLDLGLAGTTAGVMRLAGSSNGNVTIQTAATAGTWTLTLPVNDGNLGDVLTTDGGGITSWTAPTAVGHAMLSTTHTDSVVNAVTRGSLIYGNASPAWDELVIGAANRLLRSNGTDVSWAQAVLTTDVTGVLPIANGGTNTNAFAINGGVVFFDGTILDTNSGIVFNEATATLQCGLYSGSGGTGNMIFYTNEGVVFSIDENNDAAESFIIRGHTSTKFTFADTGLCFLGGSTAPAAVCHLAAGTAAANTAPLKFTSGTNLTTPEAGAMEYNGRFFLTDTDAARRHIVQAVADTKTTAGAPYANDGYIELVIGGTTRRVMTTA